MRTYPRKRNPFLEGRAGAKAAGREWTLTQEQYTAIMGDRRCFYCGGDCGKSAGLDRVDSSKGYTPDNVVPCCLECNSSKRDWPQSVFISRLVYSAYHSATGSPGGEA